MSRCPAKPELSIYKSLASLHAFSSAPSSYPTALSMSLSAASSHQTPNANSAWRPAIPAQAGARLPAPTLTNSRKVTKSEPSTQNLGAEHFPGFIAKAAFHPIQCTPRAFTTPLLVPYLKPPPSGSATIHHLTSALKFHTLYHPVPPPPQHRPTPPSPRYPGPHPASLSAAHQTSAPSAATASTPAAPHYQQCEGPANPKSLSFPPDSNRSPFCPRHHHHTAVPVFQIRGR